MFGIGVCCDMESVPLLEMAGDRVKVIRVIEGTIEGRRTYIYVEGNCGLRINGHTKNFLGKGGGGGVVSETWETSVQFEPVSFMWGSILNITYQNTSGALGCVPFKLSLNISRCRWGRGGTGLRLSSVQQIHEEETVVCV